MMCCETFKKISGVCTYDLLRLLQVIYICDIVSYRSLWTSQQKLQHMCPNINYITIAN
jgi:hypothetical protein